MQHLESLSRYLGPNTIPTNYRKFHYVGLLSHRVDFYQPYQKGPAQRRKLPDTTRDMLHGFCTSSFMRPYLTVRTLHPMPH